MLIEELKNIRAEKGDLRKFGIMFGVVLGLLGGLFLWRGKIYAPYVLTVSPVFLVFGILLPLLLKPVHKIVMTLAICIGWCVSRIILIVLFYVVVTPLGLLARLCGRKFLDINANEQRDTYWVRKESPAFDKARYEQQF